MNKSPKPFPYLILFTAICVSGSAAFYSVYGLSKLFSGASFAVIIMAGSLEFSKIIITSALHFYWKVLTPHYLKWYLVGATVVLVLITSSGIYGFLSDAYQQTSDKDKMVERRVQLLEAKKDRFISQCNEYKVERENVSKGISNLRTSLSTDNQVQTIDRRTGQVLTNIQSTSKKNVKEELNLSNEMNNELFSKIERLNDSIATYELNIIEFKSKETVSELGPLRYISSLTGVEMDKVVNWFLIMLMLVFDPLAIALVLLGLFAFNHKDEVIVENPIQPIEPTPEPEEPIEEVIGPIVALPTEVIEPPVKAKRKYNRKSKPHFDNDSSIDIPPTTVNEPSNVQVEENTSVPLIYEKVEPVVEEEVIQPPIVEEPIVQVPVKKPRKPSKSKVVDTTLTPDIAEHLSQSLLNKKKR